MKLDDYVHRLRAEIARRQKRLLLSAIGRLARLIPNTDGNDPFHDHYWDFVQAVQRMDRPRVLEIGSRNVSGNVQRDKYSNAGEYVGFDVHPGPNVDVVGDAHRLSSVLPAEHFDAAFCISVFEHLAMPWKVTLELNRVLRPGGLLFVATHPVWPAHELPWDFWRFGSESFKVLFNQRTGFELLRVNEGAPCSIIPHGGADPEVARFPGFLAVAVTARKVGPPDEHLHWDVAADEILESIYPKPQG